MGIFNKKKAQKTIVNEDPKENKDAGVLGRGIRTVKDLFAPPSFDRSNENHMKVGSKHVRSFVMNGFPASVGVGWLDQLFNYEGDMDTAIYVEPTDERTALDELTAKITQFEAQLQMEMQKGNIRNITRLKNIVTQLYDQRERLEQNYENLFHVQIASNLYAETAEELDKETQKLDNKLKGRKMFHMPVYLRQDDGYKTVLPFGKTYLPDKFRNFNSGALTACFPFYNSEVSHKTGVFCGVNLSTMTPVLIDFYDRKKLNNGNLTVFGQAGSGKTFFVSLLTLRSALKGVRTVIIDPEGEYKKLTKAVGGSHIYIAPESNTHINPFDLEEEDLTEEDIREGKPEVDIKSKVSDVLNLIGVMAGGLTPEQRSIVSYVITELYQERGFNEDRRSLYSTDPIFNEETGEFYHDGMKKRMPTFSDFHEKLEGLVNKEGNKDLKSLSNALKMFKKGGVYDMFDCQTSEDLKDFKNSPIVTFDISRLEESVLRPIGMYIALSWTWEKFVKKNPEIKKRIVCDEAWMLVNKNMAGNEYTAQFLETAARRIRKRNGGLLVASQNFIEFANNEQGKAVLTNAVVNIFLRQDATDIDAVQDTFKLSDGERNFLLTAKKGELLIKMNGESSVAYAMSFPYEQELISKAYVSKD
ncbi:VirB4 family type IV secretion system protein [Brevibacillus sp. NPDC058079]|uniref:VirB4 family type IV secretion system protein n=1 Tax=Brevibacillus sp. NPDC058079 TaxID=3346330 RepID=UPI0036EF34E5